MRAKFGRLRTRLFDQEEAKNMKTLARKLGMSYSELYRVREGKRDIGQRFIVGVLTAFPDRRFEDLFYIA